jgi:short chain dehydrogenase
MGHVGAARRTVYCASKHAMEGFTKAMAIELASHNIRVNSLGPTFLETPMTRPFFENKAPPSQSRAVRSAVFQWTKALRRHSSSSRTSDGVTRAVQRTYVSAASHRQRLAATILRDGAGRGDNSLVRALDRGQVSFRHLGAARPEVGSMPNFTIVSLTHGGLTALKRIFCCISIAAARTKPSRPAFTIERDALRGIGSIASMPVVRAIDPPF